MSEHTPAPWRERWDYKRLNDEGRVLANAVGPQHICTGIRLGDSKFYRPDAATMGKVYADARLIAAAPDLLDALKGLLDFIEIDKLAMDSMAIGIARAAIAKAELPASKQFQE